MINLLGPWAPAVIAIPVALWIMILLTFKRGLLRRRHYARLGVLLLFAAALAAVFLIWGSDPIFSLAATLIPLVWTIIDSILQEILHDRQREIYLVLKSGTPYCRDVARSIEAGVKLRLPGVQLQVLKNQHPENINEQLANFQTAVSKAPDAIVVVPSPHSSSLERIAVEALRHNIPIVTIDSKFSAAPFHEQGLFPPSFVGTDFTRGGEIAAQEMLYALNGHGRVVVIAGPHESGPSELRKKAFIDEISSSPTPVSVVAVKYTSWNTLEARKAISDLLESGMEFNGVFCCNDDLALAVVQEFKERSLPVPTIIGFDGVEEIYMPILEGTVHATVDVTPQTQGSYAVEHLARILANKRAYFKVRQPPLLTTPRLLTAEVVRASMRVTND